jgi:hypothetical protein
MKDDLFPAENAAGRGNFVNDEKLLTEQEIERMASDRAHNLHRKKATEGHHPAPARGDAPSGKATALYAEWHSIAS